MPAEVLAALKAITAGVLAAVCPPTMARAFARIGLALAKLEELPKPLPAGQERDATGTA